MSTRRLSTALSLACCILLSLPVTADEASGEQEVPRLIKQLDSDEFAERQEASRKLAELGPAAIAALEAAAQGESHEAASRAMEILKTHFQKGTPDLQMAAKEALQRIAKGMKPAARHAEEILSPKPQPSASPERPVAPGLRLGGLPLRVMVAGAAAKRVTTKMVNGVKDIDVEEEGRKVKIHDDPAKGIEVEVTQTKDGKEATEKYAAKDADELKTKHPEAHKLYEEYSKGGGIRVVGGFRAIAPLVPPVGPAPAAPPPAPAEAPRVGEPPRTAEAPVLPPIKLRTAETEKQLGEKLNAAIKAIKELETALAQVAKSAAGAEELARAKDSLEVAKKRLEELKAKLAE